MNNINNEELDAFLVEVDLVNQKVKDLAENRMSPTEFDELQKARGQDKQRRIDFKIRKEKEAYEAKVRGTDGKGITKDFSHFCRFCHKQFELPTPTCLKCNRPTMTLEQRQKQLEGMVEDYKFNKRNRQQKRHRFDMWQKTQAQLWTKTSINYNQKWDNFVEDSDPEDEQDPIVPKNDPNFKALEVDIEERKKRREDDTKKAKALKQKGNKAIKEGDNQRAMQMYTLALEHIKDIKSIYTNRALAFIRLKRYNKAIKDCTSVIEYMEVFEKVGQNKDLTFKAYSRRSLANKELKNYKDALKDVEEALKLFPDDKTVLLLKKEVESMLAHAEKVQKIISQNKKSDQSQENKEQKQEQKQEQKKEQEQSDNQQDPQLIEKRIIKQLAEKQLKEEKEKQKQNEVKQQQTKKSQPKMKIGQNDNPLTEIPKRLKDLNEENIEYLINTLIKNRDMKSIFVSSKGVQTCLSHMINNKSNGKQVLLIGYCLDRDGVAEKRIWQWGFYKLYDQILAKFEDQSKLNQSVYQFIGNIFQVLIPVSLCEQYRIELSNSPKTHSFVEQLYPKLLTKIKKQPGLLDSLLIYMTNIASGQNSFKNKYLLQGNKLRVLVESLYMTVVDLKTKNRKYLELKKNVYGFVANVITNVELRKNFIGFMKDNQRFVELRNQIQSFPKTNINFYEFMENLLSVCVNMSMDMELELEQIAEALFDRFVSHYKEYMVGHKQIIYRSLLAISRLKYKSNKVLKKWINTFDYISQVQNPLKNQQQRNMVQIVKILNAIAQVDQISSLPPGLFTTLIKYLVDNTNHENLFCNTANLFGLILGKNTTPLKENIYQEMQKDNCMKRLVQIAKEKTGNWRKSSSILIAKSSADPECRKVMDKFHGMQVLRSVADFIKK